MKRRHVVLMPLAALALSSPCQAEPVTPSLTVCEAAPFIPTGEVPDLQGQWDFLMMVGSEPSPGGLALGPMDDAYAGSLTPYRTNTVAVRRLTLVGGTVSMSVASREGEVRFEGRLTGNPDTMCGTVMYHGGQRLPMVAVRRPTRYASRQAAPSSSTAASPSPALPAGHTGPIAPRPTDTVDSASAGSTALSAAE